MHQAKGLIGTVHVHTENQKLIKPLSFGFTKFLFLSRTYWNCCVEDSHEVKELRSVVWRTDHEAEERRLVTQRVDCEVKEIAR